MSFRFGFISGFASGYYLGAKAGRQRYEQIHNTLQRMEGLRAKAKDFAETGVEKARTIVGHRRSNKPYVPPYVSNGAPTAADVVGGPDIAAPRAT